jgi:hypothetical protein
MGRFDDKPTELMLRRQREWEKFDQGELDAAVSAMLEQRQTRRYLWWLLSVSKSLGENAFTANALTTAFGCGEQNVGQQVLAHMLEVAPEGFLILMKENADERRSRQDELDRIRSNGGTRDYSGANGDEPGTYA